MPTDNDTRCRVLSPDEMPVHVQVTVELQVNTDDDNPVPAQNVIEGAEQAVQNMLDMGEANGFSHDHADRLSIGVVSVDAEIEDDQDRKQIAEDEATAEAGRRVRAEVVHEWLQRPVGWHPMHSDYMMDIHRCIQENGSSGECLYLHGFWGEDSAEIDFPCNQFPLTEQGLRDAMTVARANYRGCLAYDDIVPLGAGDIVIGIYPDAVPTNNGIFFMVNCDDAGNSPSITRA